MTPDHDEVDHAHADRHENRRAVTVALIGVVVIIIACILLTAG